MIAGQCGNLNIMDQPESHGRIEIAHCLSVKIYYTTGERSDVIDFNDDLPAGILNEGIPQLPAMTNPAKLSTQINLNGRLFLRFPTYVRVERDRILMLRRQSRHSQNP